MLSRRHFLASTSGAAISTVFGRKSEAWPRRGVLIGTGWNTLPLGAGGLLNGFDFAPDGTLVCWTDVGNVYRWSGTLSSVDNPGDRWVPLATRASFIGITTTPLLNAGSNGSIGMAIAYSQTTRLLLWYSDVQAVSLRYWVYYSNNSGTTWSKSNLQINTINGDSNFSGYPSRMSSERMMFDPANADYAYCGMVPSSGNGAGAFKSTDGGATWTSVKLSPGGSAIADTTVKPGCCGMVFDTKQGTIVNAAGDTVTKRILLPVGGVGVYESMDGGDNWSEIFVSAFGGTTFGPFRGRLDFDGVFYMLLTTDGANVRVWRYSGPTPASGPTNTWGNISGGSTYPYTLSATATNAILIVDPRVGHQGEVSIAFNNGIGTGYNSVNANTPTVNSITWSGATTAAATIIAENYDVPWLNDLNTVPPGGQTFLSGTDAKIAPDGKCFWSGFRAFWYFPTMPDYGPPSSTTQYSVGRGIEETVSEYVCCPPGAVYPVMASQDVGIMRGTFTNYPAKQYVEFNRPPAFFLDYAASDPSYMVGRITFQYSNAAQLANTFSVCSYNPNYGAPGEWIAFPTQPDGTYNCFFNGSVSSGVLTVNSVTSGVVQPRARIYLPGALADSQTKGDITAQLTGTPGGAGTYSLTSSIDTATNDFQAFRGTQGGAIVAVDPLHIVTVPSGLNQPFIPLYTDDGGATAWKFCSGLPNLNWCRRSAANGNSMRPLAVDYGTALGHVYIAGKRDQLLVTGAVDGGGGAGGHEIRLTVASTSTMVTGSRRSVAAVGGVTSANNIWTITVVDATHIDLQGSTFSGAYTSGGTIDGADVFKSTDSGANFSLVGSVPMGATGGTPYLFTTPGYPGNLWFTTRFTAGAGVSQKLWRSLDGGVTWDTPALPGAAVPSLLCLGSPQTPGGYPTVFLAVWGGFNTHQTIYYSTNGNAANPANITWATVGATGGQADWTPLASIIGFVGIMGDWNKFKRLYGVSAQSGYSYYNES